MPHRKSSVTFEEDEDFSDSEPSLHEYRAGSSKRTSKRTSRACDQCRKTKTRCDHSGDSSARCRSCLLSGYECTFFEPSQKRGPPKGYLSALENRLHEAEALLGVIISSNDLRAKTLVSDLARDSLAKSIIKRVTRSVFGPIGREAVRGRGSLNLKTQEDDHRFPHNPTDSRRQQMNSREVALMKDDNSPVFTTPSNAWQDHLCCRLITEATYACYPVDEKRRSRSPSESPSNSNSEAAAFPYIVPYGFSNPEASSLSGGTTPELSSGSIPETFEPKPFKASAPVEQQAPESDQFVSTTTPNPWYPHLDTMLDGYVIESHSASSGGYLCDEVSLESPLCYGQQQVPQGLRLKYPAGRSSNVFPTQIHSIQTPSPSAIQTSLWEGMLG